MKVPDKAHRRIKGTLWRVADEVNWSTLSDQQKSAFYERWVRGEQIGEVLSRYLSQGSVRVYIKDTIMKPYGRERIKDFSPVVKLLELHDDPSVAEIYTKPHGRRLTDGKVICWGLSRDWKAILFSVFERAHVAPSAVPFAAVIMYPTGKCQQPEYREMIERAGAKLGIMRIEWYDS